MINICENILEEVKERFDFSSNKLLTLDYNAFYNDLDVCNEDLQRSCHISDKNVNKDILYVYSLFPKNNDFDIVIINQLENSFLYFTKLHVSDYQYYFNNIKRVERLFQKKMIWKYVSKLNIKYLFKYLFYNRLYIHIQKFFNSASKLVELMLLIFITFHLEE